MKRSLVVAGLWCILPLLATAQDSSKIIAMENLSNRAELTMNASAVRLLLADDFVMTVAEGTLYNKTQMIASVAGVSSRCPAVDRHGSSLLRKYGGGHRRLLRKGNRQRQTLGAPRPLYRYLDESGWEVAMHCESFQRQAEMNLRRQRFRSENAGPMEQSHN